jgi:hypothetical protein
MQGQSHATMKKEMHIHGVVKMRLMQRKNQRYIKDIRVYDIFSGDGQNIVDDITMQGSPLEIADAIASSKVNAKFIASDIRPISVDYLRERLESKSVELRLCVDLFSCLKFEVMENSASNQLDVISDYLKQDLNLKARIKNDVINYFGEQTGKNIEVLNQSKYIDKELIDNINTTKKLSPNEQAEIVVKAYTVNSWIHNFETINLFYGDLAQFNHAKEEMHKRNTGSTSGGPKFLTGPVAENFINNFWNKETYASKYAARTGKPENNKFTNFNSTINTAVIKDIERSSELLQK